MGCVAAVMCAPMVSKAEEKKETPLGKEMHAMNDAYKAMRREKDPVKGAEEAREAQAAVLKCLQELPSTVSEIADPDAKAKASVKYRTMIAKLYISFCEIEDAYMAKDLAKAEQLIGSLREAKKEGHDAFMEDE